MSTDLELSLPVIKTATNSQISDNIISNVKEEDQDCHTPKSPRYMIPAILTCPPAPRKPRRRAMGPTTRKRKLLCEMEFFEIVNRDEVEAFFTRVEEGINGGGNKRRCLM
ncbi:hypothetical protein CDL12_22691 [Handroanthus impetiginosus]|uniref:Uncharacterized protein n=1 Tax=Handroanthus impetiginosus TaxID=429701 RepID=A0A2G9GHL5_9LAMI|nr:hypothetical protein CDL12_22691 [Handroanthus impetiginosus]